MSQAAAGGGERPEVERTLVQRSLQDEDFRQRLLADQGDRGAGVWEPAA